MEVRISTPRSQYFLLKFAQAAHRSCMKCVNITQNAVMTFELNERRFLTKSIAFWDV